MDCCSASRATRVRTPKAADDEPAAAPGHNEHMSVAHDLAALLCGRWVAALTGAGCSTESFAKLSAWTPEVRER